MNWNKLSKNIQKGYLDGIAKKYNIKYNSIIYEAIFCGDRSDADRDYKYHGYIIESVNDCNVSEGTFSDLILEKGF